MGLGPLHAVTGRCACGQVTYRCDVEAQAVLCACDLCRRNSGSAFQAWVNGQRASLRMTGETSQWPSTDHATRHFCKSCGSTLFLFERDEPDVVEIAAGTVDEPHGVASSRLSKHYRGWPAWSKTVAARR